MLRKQCRVLSLVMVFVLAAAGVLQAEPGIKIKLFGEGAYWNTGGDFKPLFESTADRWSKVGIHGTYDLDYKPWAYKGGAQLLIEVAPNIDLALSGGYLHKAWNQKPQLSYADGPGTLNINQTYKVDGVPFALDLQIGIPLGPAKINIFGGGDFFLGRVALDSSSLYSEPNRKLQPNWKWEISESFSASKNALGFHGGLGLDIRLFGNINLCFDAIYRFLSMTDIQGTFDYAESQTWTGGHNSGSSHSTKSTMWYSTSNVWGNIWHYLDFNDTKPLWNDSAKPFKIDLGGLAFRIGLKFGI
jgi:hypothetical protein